MSAGKGQNVILEEGKREEFKRCFIEDVDILAYPCGHVYIPVYSGSEVRDAVPLTCPRCSPLALIYGDYEWAKLAISGVTCTQDTVVIDMSVEPVMPLEYINVQFTVGGDGVILTDDR